MAAAAAITKFDSPQEYSSAKAALSRPPYDICYWLNVNTFNLKLPQSLTVLYEWY